MAKSRVERSQFAQKDIERPTIRDDVVERDGQNVILLVQLKKLRAPQRSAREVERNARVLRQKNREPVWPCPQIAIGKHEVHLRVDDLHRLSILHLKGGAQRFVATSDLMKRTDQRTAIECAFEA